MRTCQKSVFFSKNSSINSAANFSTNYETAEKVGFERTNYPFRLPLTQGGGLITKQFPRLCKEGTGVVVQGYGTFSAAS